MKADDGASAAALGILKFADFPAFCRGLEAPRALVVTPHHAIVM
jgi:hypothetical protein